MREEFWAGVGLGRDFCSRTEAASLCMMLDVVEVPIGSFRARITLTASPQ